jgi:2-isopropylmalate synthase
MGAQSETYYSPIFGGHGADTDIIVASAKAYINALNKLLTAKMEAKQSRKEMAAVS